MSGEESGAMKGVSLHFRAKEVMEGEGVLLTRAIGTNLLRNLDPFLLYDTGVVTCGQFPDHPHRGFEVVSYLKQGRFVHEDFLGNSGAVTPGDFFLMTTGKGIVHAEKIDTPVVEGTTVWINLKSEKKRCNPNYHLSTMGDAKIASDRGAGIEAVILAGSALGETAQSVTQTPASIYEFKMNAGAVLSQPITPTWNSMIYVEKGQVSVGGKKVNPAEVAVFSMEGSNVEVKAEEKSQFMMLAGEPCNEPCVQYGPFVMNTREEIAETFNDFYGGKNGFEGAPQWRSQLFYG